ncbi:hypothetical protein ACHAXA_001075 [Cyclostephanos tholiformis]|uniref:tRNA-dihydrouridine(16/17) synthase [NAD(P)(+)] n=1 Tax=Cyclostephanos tholiformis TaxID=382380 RepID=A0ABD3R1V4_9STRA
MRDAHPDDTANLVVQPCGSDPVEARDGDDRAAQDIREQQCRRRRGARGGGILPFGIDLNLGCPRECVLNGGYGAFLAERDADAAVSCVSSMRHAIDAYKSRTSGDIVRNGPLLSAKIRLLDKDIDDTIDPVRRLHRAGVDYATVHCRRRRTSMRAPRTWKPGAGSWMHCHEMHWPIILNGRISNYDDARRVMELTNCHAVMAATGYLRDHRKYGPSMHDVDVASLALEYLEYAERYPPPSYLYIQKHMRWIFRNVLQPPTSPVLTSPITPIGASSYGPSWYVRS